MSRNFFKNLKFVTIVDIVSCNFRRKDVFFFFKFYRLSKLFLFNNCLSLIKTDYFFLHFIKISQLLKKNPELNSDTYNLYKLLLK